MADRELVLRIVADIVQAEQNLKVIEGRINEVTKAFQKGELPANAYQKELKELAQGAATAKANIKDLEDAQKKLEGTTAKGATTLEKFGGMVARYFSVAAVGAAAKATIDWADNISDLSDRTGISITNLQKFDAVARVSGNSLEQVSDAVLRLSDRLGSRDKGAVAAIQRLGLNFDALLKMKPDEQFIAVAKGLEQLGDKASQAAVEADLFGRSGTQLHATLMEVGRGIEDITVASEENIRVLGEAADAWEELKRTALVYGATLLGPVMQAINAVTDAWRKLPAAAGGGNVLGTSGLAGFMGGVELGRQMFTVGALPGVSGPGMGTGSALATPGLPADLDFVLKDSTRAIRASIAAHEKIARAADRAADEFQIEGYLLAEYNKRLAAMNATVRPVGEQFMTKPPTGLMTFPLPGGGILTVPSITPTFTPGAAGAPGGGFWSQFRGLFGGAAGSALGNMAGSAIGGTLGSVVGSAVPIVGTLLGSFLGNAIGGLFGPSKGAIEGKRADADIKSLQADLLATYGSLDKIRAMGELVGVSLADAWGDKNVAGLKHFQQLAQQFETQMDRLQRALDKYGLTWEDLGKKAQQFFLEAEAEELLKDFKLLQQAGVDENILLEKMAGHWNALYQSAVRNGLEVPNALRPILEKLIELGLLLDEAGQKVQTLDGLFRDIDPPTITIPVEYEYRDRPEDPYGPTEGMGAMNGGLASWRGVTYAPLGGYVRGTDTVLAALTPGEYVMSRETVKRLGADRLRSLNRGGGDSGAAGTIVVNVDARDSVWDGVSAQKWADKVADKLMVRVKANARLNGF